MKYLWDERKNKANYKKHGVWFDEALAVLERADYLSVIDDTSGSAARQLGTLIALGY